MPTAQMTCAVCEVHAEAVFRVEGLDCNDEVVILERRLKPIVRTCGSLRGSHGLDDWLIVFDRSETDVMILGRQSFDDLLRQRSWVGGSEGPSGVGQLPEPSF